MDPLALHKLLRALLEAQLALGIVGLGEVLDDGAGLEERDAGVGVLDRGHAAVDADLLVGVFLQLAHVHELLLVGDVELLEDDGDLPGVGAGCWACLSVWDPVICRVVTYRGRRG